MAISSISIGAAGMQRASHQLEQSAGRIARFSTGLEEVDMTKELVNVIEAEANFKASAKVVSVAGDLSRRLLDILA